MSAGGRRKPAFYEFQTLAAATRKRQLDVIRSAKRTNVKGLEDLLRGTVGVRDESGLSWVPFSIGP